MADWDDNERGQTRSRPGSYSPLLKRWLSLGYLGLKDSRMIGVPLQAKISSGTQILSGAGWEEWCEERGG